MVKLSGAVEAMSPHAKKARFVSFEFPGLVGSEQTGGLVGLVKLPGRNREPIDPVHIW
jgi:hypothetical protein